MTPPRWLFLLPALALTACEPVDEAECATVLCAPCAPALVVRLHGAAGQLPPNAVLEGAQGDCSEDGGTTVCTVTEGRSGTFEFDIQATGYQKAHVSEKVASKVRTGCCTCDYESRTVDVQLTPQ